MNSNEKNLYNENLISHYCDPKEPLRSLVLSEISFKPLTEQEEFCLKRSICQLKREEAGKLEKRLSELEEHLKQHEWIVIYLQKETIFAYNFYKLGKK